METEGAVLYRAPGVKRQRKKGLCILSHSCVLPENRRFIALLLIGSQAPFIWYWSQMEWNSAQADLWHSWSKKVQPRQLIWWHLWQRGWGEEKTRRLSVFKNETENWIIFHCRSLSPPAALDEDTMVLRTRCCLSSFHPTFMLWFVSISVNSGSSQTF